MWVSEFLCWVDGWVGKGSNAHVDVVLFNIEQQAVRIEVHAVGGVCNLLHQPTALAGH